MIRLSKSIVGELEKAAVSSVIDKGYLGMGSFVESFEKALEMYLGGGQVVCVNSGTAALHLGLMAFGFNREDEVLIQSLTYVASFQAITAAGLRPVPCEILAETCTIDLKDAETRLTPKTRAIMPVHYASRPGNLDEVFNFAQKYGLRVIEDAAHAFGSLYKGKKIGSFGDVTCFSFDGIKNITSGEGGAVVTQDEKVARYVMDARLLGVEKDTAKRFAGQRSWEFDVTHQGYRYHMSNLFAAIGIEQLKKFEKEFKPKRQMLARKYHELLSRYDEVRMFPYDYEEIVPHIFPIRVPKDKRDKLRTFLFDRQIECGIHYYPNHRLTFFGADEKKLPKTEDIYNELLTLPLHPDISENDQNYVVRCIKEFFL